MGSAVNCRESAHNSERLLLALNLLKQPLPHENVYKREEFLGN